MKLRDWRIWAAVLLAAAQMPAAAQTSRVVVGSVPGTPGDNVARLVADILREGSGRQWITENRAGAGGRIGAEVIKSAVRDGNSLMVAPGGLLTVVPHTDAEPKYDALKDFLPVARVASFDVAFAVSPKSGNGSLKEYLGWLKADNARAVFGTPQYGGIPHLFGLKLGQVVGIPMTNVPYKGGGPQFKADLLGGHLPAASSAVPEFLLEQKRGDLKVLATAGDRRSRFMPEVPTFRELGYPDLVATLWFGVFAPAGVPAGAIQSLNTMLTVGLKQTVFIDRLAAMGLEPSGGDPALLQKQLRAEFEFWGGAVKAFGIKAE